MKGRMGNDADLGRPSKKQKWGGDVVQVLMFLPFLGQEAPRSAKKRQ